MTDPADSLVTWASRDHGSCARHRGYALDCKQFDALLKRSEGKCELCGLEGVASAWGLLHIDHEHQVGRWAVRGLLCDGCNARLQRGRRLPPTPPLQRYLANAWYRQELKRLGLSGEIPPEPGLGSMARTDKRLWLRMDTEVERCWGSMHGKVHCMLKSWRQLWYEYGPFRLQITDERDSFPAWVTRTTYSHGFWLIRQAKKRLAHTGQPEAAPAREREPYAAERSTHAQRNP